MNLECAKDSETVARFESETAAVSRIDHPNVVKIIEIGKTDDGRPWFTMPYMNGQSLGELLREQKMLPITDSISLFTQVCDGLKAAHDAHIIHRDIKPANLITLLDRKVILIDFGIAKLISRAGDPTMPNTSTGSVFGTPTYMSPEQCTDSTKLDHRSDIYSVGCLMYEVLTGSPPFTGNSPFEIMRQHFDALPKPLSLRNEDIRLVQRLDQIIVKALKPDPDQRYQSIAELSFDLKATALVASKKSRLASAVKLKGEDIYRAISNRLGPNKRLIITSLAVASVFGLLLIVSNIFLAPYMATYMTTREPEGAPTEIIWQRVDPSPLRTPEKFEKRENQLNVECRKEKLQSSTNSPITPEFFMISKDTADLFFKNQRYKEASSYYNEAAFVGNELIQKGIETQISDMASTCLCAAFCALKLEDYRRAKTFCDSGLVLAKRSNLRPDDQAFFYGIRATSCSILRNDQYLNFERRREAEQLATADSAVFLGYLDKPAFRPENSYDIAPLISEIGDYYFTTGDFVRANQAYAKAISAWDTLDRGKYNQSVCNVRLGLIARKQQKFSEAVELFKNAASEFEKDGHTLARINTLFYLANTYWKMKDSAKDLYSMVQYSSSGFSTRLEAANRWKELKVAKKISP